MRSGAGVTIVAIAALFALTAAGGPLAAGHGQKLVFASNRGDGQRDLYVVSEDGTGLRRLTFDGESYRERDPSWSPDGSRIAFAALHDGNFDIYTMDANGGDRRRVTSDPARDAFPEWINDGRILFTRGFFTSTPSEWIVNADGTNEQRLALSGNASMAEAVPHGNRIVYASYDATGAWSTLHVATLGPGGTVSDDRSITSPPHEGADQGDFEPHWAPNGSDIVFLRDHQNIDNDIFVVHSDGSGLKRLTDTPNRVEFSATWSSDGKSVLFQDFSIGKLKAIDVASGAERLVGTSPTAPFTDDFGDGIRDTSMWHQIQDPGSSAAEAGGRMVFSISGSAVPGGQWNQVDTHIGSQCSLVGDFDYQVDYELLNWPHLGGFRANLSAFFTNASIGRASVPIPWAPSWGDEQVQGWSDGGGGQFQSNDMAGTFRLVRKNGVVTGYVRSGSDWRPAFSGTATGDDVYGIGFSTQASDFGHQDGSVAYDNFTLSSGTFHCPDWWQDLFPDVYYG